MIIRSKSVFSSKRGYGEHWLANIGSSLAITGIMSSERSTVRSVLLVPSPNRLIAWLIDSYSRFHFDTHHICLPSLQDFHVTNDTFDAFIMAQT